jgi:hypothetical protein
MPERMILGYEVSAADIKRKPRLVGVLVDEHTREATTEQIQDFLNQVEDIQYNKEIIRINKNERKR